MKNSDIKFNSQSLSVGLNRAAKVFKTYRALMFFLAVALLYGFILWRINVYSNVPASQNNTDTTVAAQPHIDQAVVGKLQTLQDNSVSVQALFNEARQNPFQE
ncbi:MAG TPA: hypothetical protein VMB52_01880 [Verrucomicrobiae bacterium]|nr:hypothetical protein [Verrucomicrobiae bacterium]